MYSHALLEGTNLALFPINKANLLRWYKNTSRREEVMMLLQGVGIPRPDLCVTSPLPSVKIQPSFPPPHTHDPHPFPEPQDMVGQA